MIQFNPTEKQDQDTYFQNRKESESNKLSKEQEKGSLRKKYNIFTIIFNFRYKDPNEKLWNYVKEGKGERKNSTNAAY